jgi:predicted TIM-barrel fold metal-dependent hydrolase
MRRCADLGHRGILFGNRYESVGLPVFTDPHWDPIYAAAQEMRLSINFHVAFQVTPETAAGAMRGALANYDARFSALVTSLSLMSNYETIAKIICSDLCERYPKLDFVSVESGFGYIPYLLEVLDWHWKGYGVVREHPMLPSEYFQRQVYGSLWFEAKTLPLLELYPDNFMFETDYPHPTSLSPGPASYADKPADHIAAHWQNVPLEVARKVLHENAARVYRWDS